VITLERKSSKKKQRIDTKKDAKRSNREKWKMNDWMAP
jgi:hypothetical protein